MNGKIGQNIMKIRKLRGMTQADLAAKLSILYGEPVLPATISRWEHGTRTIPAEAVWHISVALGTSAQAFYDYKTTDDDKKLLLEYAAMPERSKEILRHVVTSWQGDRHALIHWIAMYTSVQKNCRADLVGPSIHHYHELCRKGCIDKNAPPPDIDYIEKACDSLMAKRKGPRQAHRDP